MSSERHVYRRPLIVTVSPEDVDPFTEQKSKPALFSQQNDWPAFERVDREELRHIRSHVMRDLIGEPSHSKSGSRSPRVSYVPATAHTQSDELNGSKSASHVDDVSRVPRQYEALLKRKPLDVPPGTQSSLTSSADQYPSSSGMDKLASPATYKQGRQITIADLAGSVAKALKQELQSEQDIMARLWLDVDDSHAVFVAVCTIAWLCMANRQAAQQLTTRPFVRNEVYRLLHHELDMPPVTFARTTSPEYLLSEGNTTFGDWSLPDYRGEEPLERNQSPTGISADPIQWLRGHLHRHQLPIPHSRRWQSNLLEVIAQAAFDARGQPHITANFACDHAALRNLPLCGSSEESLGSLIAWTTDGTHVQADCCSSYASGMWPSVAEGCIELLERAFQYGDSIKVIRSNECYVVVDLRFYANKTIEVIISGASHLIFDVLSLFTWVGAACYTDSTEKVVLRSPYLRSIGHSTSSRSLLVTYTNTALETSSLTPDSSCWHALARNFFIADDFTVTRRDHAEPGVEMPLDVMLALGAIDNLTLLNGVPQLKGYSTRFTIESCTDKSIVWHFAAAPSGKMIPLSEYNHAPSKFPIQPEDTLTELRKYRHFVGWLPSARCDVVGAPTTASQLDYDPEEDNVTADEIRDPSEDQQHTVTVLQGACLPQIRTIAHLVQPISNNTSGRFGFVAPRLGDILEQASNALFLMFDTAQTARKGYLLNGVDALAYMSFKRLRGSTFRQTLSDAASTRLYDFLTSASQVPVVNTCAYLASHESIAIDTSGCTFGALLREMWETLAHLIFLQCNPPSGLQFRITAPFVLEGWPLGSILRRDANLPPCLTSLSPASAGWLRLIRDLAVPTLLGEDIGDIVVPNSTQKCQLCRKMPSEKDFVAIRLADLLRIHKRKRRKAGFAACITSTCGWTQTNNAVFTDRTADCLTCTSALLHEIVPFTLEDERPLVQVEHYKEGAVILGAATQDGTSRLGTSLLSSCTTWPTNTNSANAKVTIADRTRTALEQRVVPVDRSVPMPSLKAARSTSVKETHIERHVIGADKVTGSAAPVSSGAEKANERLASNIQIVMKGDRTSSKIPRPVHTSTDGMYHQHMASTTI